MWEQFREGFMKYFFPNNILYVVYRMFQELKQKGSIRAYVKEFTSLTLQIHNLTEEEVFFHFLNRLHNLSKT